MTKLLQIALIEIRQIDGHRHRDKKKQMK